MTRCVIGAKLAQELRRDIFTALLYINYDV